MAKNKNKNIVPLKHIDELENECQWEDFEFKEYFETIAILEPNLVLQKF